LAKDLGFYEIRATARVYTKYIATRTVVHSDARAVSSGFTCGCWARFHQIAIVVQVLQFQIVFGAASMEENHQQQQRKTRRALNAAINSHLSYDTCFDWMVVSFEVKKKPYTDSSVSCCNGVGRFLSRYLLRGKDQDTRIYSANQKRKNDAIKSQ
jgi:hypothetical protein